MADTTLQADRVRLRLLGAFGLTKADGARINLTSRRARGLLAYIHLAPDQMAQRERLCGLFWSDRGEAQARASLRQCLFELREALSAFDLDLLEVGRESVGFRTQVTSDLMELTQALRADDAATSVAGLGAAGREPLMAGFELGGLFQDWLDQARAHQDQRLADSVHASLARLEAAERWTDVRAIADVFRHRDPLDEAVVAAAIRAEVASGEAAAAQRRFQALKAGLADALGVAPGPAVVAAIAEAATPAKAASASPPAEPRTQARERPTIAVLPFGFPPGDQEQAYFAEGVAEDIIAGLARSKLLSVMPRQSSLTFEAQGLSTARICADLGVDYIVQGQVRRGPATVRVSAHLVSGSDDATVWSARYDRPIDDLFAVQDEITTAIVGTIEPALLGHEEARALRSTHSSLAHWDLLMRGRWHFWRSTPQDSRKAQALLTQALALKPADTQALSLMAHCWLVEVWAGTAADPRQSIAEAQRCSLKAVSLDGSDAFAHFTHGVVLSTMGRSDQDMAEQRRALELNPDMPAAHGEMGRLYAFAGRADDALSCCDRAIRASPNDPHVWLWLFAKAIACFTAERYAEAATHAADACARRPDYFFLHFLQAACAAADGREAEARDAVAQGQALMPRYTLGALALGHPFVDPAHLDRYVAALNSAGWIETAEPRDG